MSRKTLKQKLKSQLREASKTIATHTELAGITINFECQKLQAIALAHGVMSSLIEAKKCFDTESEGFKSYEKVAQIRISQCVATLITVGMSKEDINKRILQGH